MKKRCIAVLLFWVLLVSLLLPLREKAHADALTASMVAAGAYAVGQSFGMNFTNAAWNSVGTMNMMEQEVSSYCGSRSITEVFGAEAIRAVAGKLVVGHVAYNAITNFLQDLASKYNLGANRVGVGFMFADDYVEKNGNIPLSDLNGWSLVIEPGTSYWITSWVGPDGQTAPTSYNNVPVNAYDPEETIYSFYGSNGVQAIVLYSNSSGATITRNHGAVNWSSIYPNPADRPSQVYGTSTGDIGSATVLNPGYGWAGTVNGYEGPDTNLDQLMGQIFGDVADTNLDVDGEVIPLDPPQPVPTWVPVDDVIDGINQTGEMLEGLGHDIGDISSGLDDLGEQILEQQEALEGIQEGVADIPGAIDTQTGVISGALDQAASDIANSVGTQTGALQQTIADNAGVVSGAIDQAVSDIQTAIGEQTATLDQTLIETAEGVQDIAEALQPGEIQPRKFDLRRLFPFCIPFDIHNLLQKFNAAASAPHVQLPFVIQSIGFSYMIDLDFSAFDGVAAALRAVELIVFAIGLAWATSKVIKW